MTAPRRAARFYRGDALRTELSVGQLMRRVLQSIVQSADRRLAAHDLTHAQWAPLFKLEQGACRTGAELARELQLDPAAMTRAIDRLEAKGLLKRVRSAADRRIVPLELTDEGRRVAAAVPEVLAEVLNAHLAGFSRDEWQSLVAMLQRMLANGEAWRDGD